MTTFAAFALLQGAKEIRVALVAAGLRIAGLLTERHPPPVVDGQPLFDYGQQVQHLIHELETAEKGVVDAENAHMKQEVRVARLRTERDRKTDDNHDKLVAARQGLDGLQGRGASFETAFVSGTAPRRAEKLLDQLAQSVTLLRDPAVEPRAVKVAGFDIDYTKVADDLEAGMVDLSDALDRLDDEKKLAEGTMLVRRQAIDGLNKTVIWAGRSAEGLFHRAGEDELAKRIRSSTRRPLRPSEQAAAEQNAPESSPESSPVASAAGEPAAESVSGPTEPVGPPAQTSTT